MAKNLTAFLAQNAKRGSTTFFLSRPTVSNPDPARQCLGKSAALPPQRTPLSKVLYAHNPRAWPGVGEVTPGALTRTPTSAKVSVRCGLA